MVIALLCSCYAVVNGADKLHFCFVFFMSELHFYFVFHVGKRFLTYFLVSMFSENTFRPLKSSEKLKKKGWAYRFSDRLG